MMLARAAVPILFQSRRRQLAHCHDFNGSSRSDIAWRHDDGAAAFWFMDGAAVSQAIVLGTIPTDWSIVGQRDFNGDGKHDVLWRDINGMVAIWLLDGATV